MNMLVQWLSDFLPWQIKAPLKFIFSPIYYLKIASNDLRAYLGLTTYPIKTIFVAGYPKSGTTWVENFISSIPGYSPRILRGSRKILRRHDLPEDAFVGFPRRAYSAIKTHTAPKRSNIEILIKNGINKVVVMYRDPRDIIVSNYYHVLKDNPWKSDEIEFADYTKMKKDDALTHSTHLIIEDFCAWVEGWRAAAQLNHNIECFFIQYEDLIANPKKVFTNLLVFYSLNLPEEQITDLINKSGAIPSNKPLRREPGKRSTRRKGGSGDWAFELNQCHKDIIKQKAGQVMIDLGYENGNAW